MKKIDFTYEITIYVEFTDEEFNLLLKAFSDPSASSYEGYIIPGVGAFMNANKNYFGDDKILRFTNHQIGICCKVLELSNFGKKEFDELYNKMFDLHTEIEKEYERITKKIGTDGDTLKKDGDTLKKATQWWEDLKKEEKIDFCRKWNILSLKSPNLYNAETWWSEKSDKEKVNFYRLWF